MPSWSCIPNNVHGQVYTEGEGRNSMQISTSPNGVLRQFFREQNETNLASVFLRTTALYLG